MLDVLIVGAGPAGTVAATVLARKGARVRLVDRARFPRDKLCGDTVNPGTLALLRRLGLAEWSRNTWPGDRRHDRHGRGRRCRPERLSRRPAGAIARTPRAGLVAAATGNGRRRRVRAMHHRSTRRDRPTADHRRGGRIPTGRFRARVVIAADGRHSTLAFGLGLARHPDRPRRWAIGAYFEGVSGVLAFGEMHVRRGGYIGVAPIPGRARQRLPRESVGGAPGKAAAGMGDAATFRDPARTAASRAGARSGACANASRPRGSSRRRSCWARSRLTSVHHAIRGTAAGRRRGRIHRSDDRGRSAVCGAGRRARGTRGARGARSRLGRRARPAGPGAPPRVRDEVAVQSNASHARVVACGRARRRSRRVGGAVGAPRDCAPCGRLRSCAADRDG